MHSQAYDASYTLESAYVLYLLWPGMTTITCVSAAQGCSVVPFRLISTFLKESVCLRERKLQTIKTAAVKPPCVK